MQIMVTNAVGEAAEPTVTIKLDETEMPYGHFIPVRVQGFCCGGDLLNESRRLDWILFTQKCWSTYSTRVEWLIKIVALPFMKKWHNSNPTPNWANISVHKSQFWVDSDLANIKYITTGDGLATMEYANITVCKHGGARTELEQANDDMKAFMLAKQMNDKTQFKMSSMINVTRKQAARWCVCKIEAVSVIDYLAKLSNTLLELCLYKLIVDG